MNSPLLPDHLADRPFRISEARAARVPNSRLRSPTLHRPTRGVRSSAECLELADRCRAFLLAIPAGVAFSHGTSAGLWGIPLPDSVRDDPLLDVIRSAELTQIRRSGVRGHRGLERRGMWTIRGLPVTTLADTWVDLGELPASVMSFDDLVVAGDHVVALIDRLAALPVAATSEDAGGADLVRPTPGLTVPSGAPRTQVLSTGLLGERGEPSLGLAQLHAVLDARIRPRGKSRLLHALRWIRADVRSPMETRSRLMFLRAGFPEPKVNHRVHDAQGGFLLMGDLVWPDQKVIGEYQGEHHATIRQRSKDRGRTARAEDEAWTLLEIFAEDLRRGQRQDDLLARFARSLGCPIVPTELE